MTLDAGSEYLAWEYYARDTNQLVDLFHLPELVIPTNSLHLFYSPHSLNKTNLERQGPNCFVSRLLLCT